MTSIHAVNASVAVIPIRKGGVPGTLDKSWYYPGAYIADVVSSIRMNIALAYIPEDLIVIWIL